MEAWVLDKNFDSIDIFDTFRSFIWTERFNSAGDFEIEVPAELGYLDLLQGENYLWMKGRERQMIIESTEIKTDAEEGPFAIITGSSLESILKRRVIWGQTVLSGNFQNGIKKLLDENVISPSIAARKIPNFVFKATDDSNITSLTVDAQYYGDNLYEAIEELCKSHDIGFKIVINAFNQFEFSLYAGADRSYAQITNPYIVFSPKFENLISSSYLKSKTDYKNAAMVAGEQEDYEDDAGNRIIANYLRPIYNLSLDSSTGLDRREMFVDANDVSRTTQVQITDSSGKTETKDIPFTAEMYNAMLKQKGKEELSEVSITESFEGEMSTLNQYVYGVDFDIGDVVEVVNEFGLEARSRVTEVVLSQDTSGEVVTPTFSTVK